MKSAPRRGCKRAGNLTAERQPLLRLVGMSRQRSNEQRLRVGMQGCRKVRRPQPIDELAEIHHSDPVADMRDRREIVADEEITDAERRLKMLRADS